MSDARPSSCSHDEPAKSRLGDSGIDSYDTVEMLGDEPPHVTHAFQSASMASVYQRVLTPEHFRPIEIHVRRQSRAVLLTRLGDLCRQPCRISGIPATLHVPPGTSLYLPAGTDSWWASDAACVNGWFHLHFSDATVHAVEEETGIRLLSHETRVDLPLLGLVKAAEEMTREGKAPSTLAWDSLAIVILDRLARLEGASQRFVTRLERLSPHQVKKVSDYLHAHLADQTPLAHLASLLELSPYHFARAFRNTVGMPPHRYQVALRMQRAKVLLQTTRISILDVGCLVGYESHSSFARSFKREFGISPIQCRALGEE